MTKIFKYEIEVSPAFSREIPADAKILDVQVQYDTPVFWVEVDEEKENKIRKFSVIGTGHRKPEVPSSYLGTFQLQKGAFIGHLYEIL